MLDSAIRAHENQCDERNDEHDPTYSLIMCAPRFLDESDAMHFIVSCMRKAALLTIYAIRVDPLFTSRHIVCPIFAVLDSYSQSVVLIPNNVHIVAGIGMFE